ncbi:precorrin-6Y C5,15-methyltransferase (decarboxylating) subunit CbiT [Fusobacterium sp. MFO224]|uniref:precorrin-6Y C5,15-methyltransferase (decarboxylating) subunit CbiT n=1 Tax=Fusobacterium sp. MFO224 TaxID=3378070 RepID=UPI0038531ED8
MHIRDEEFIRNKVPMTKAEIRMISIGKLDLKKDSILIDVGAGTGSVGIEASTYLSKGKVYAIEKKDIGVELINKNLKKLKVNNLEVIHGNAPIDLKIKTFNRMFVGGSSSNMQGIIDYFLNYCDSLGIIVINIIALETLTEVLKILKANKDKLKDIEIVNVNISKNKNIGNYTMMTGENPIYIISAKKI